jgi:hypothetical protein
MTQKNRIAKVERQARHVRKPARLVNVTEHDGRYFDTTHYHGFDYSRMVAAMTLDGCINAGFAELTKAQVDELEKRGALNITFDYSRLIAGGAA